MCKQKPSFLLAAAVAAAGIGALALLWLAQPEQQVQPRLPGQDLAPGQTAGASRQAANAGTLVPGEGVAVPLPGGWPQFRGPDRTGRLKSAAGLYREWPGEGPRLLWRTELGEGHAGPVVADGRVYVFDYDRQRREDAFRCLSLADGREIWRYTYSADIKRNHGMSRTVPAVAGGIVVGISPKCIAVCLDRLTGELLWRKDLVAEHETVVPPWYAGQCPLIDDGKLILAPGGTALLMAVELATGRVLWETPNPDGWGMTHSSVLAATLAGVRQYVYCSTRGVVAVAPDDGRVLWRHPDWRISIANVPSPVQADENRLLFTGGYGAGAMLLELAPAAGGITPREAWRTGPAVFGSNQQTPVLANGHIFGVLPNGEMACLGLDGSQRWTSGHGRRFGLGPYLLAGDLIYALNDMDGTLVLAEARPDAYRELAAANIRAGHDAWGPMALAGGRLLLRDMVSLICLEVGRLED